MNQSEKEKMVSEARKSLDKQKLCVIEYLPNGKIGSIKYVKGFVDGEFNELSKQAIANTNEYNLAKEKALEEKELLALKEKQDLIIELERRYNEQKELNKKFVMLFNNLYGVSLNSVDYEVLLKELTSEVKKDE